MITPYTPYSPYVFDLEVIFFITIFAFRFDRRSFFPLRILLSLGLIALFTFAWTYVKPYLPADIIFYAIFFIGLIFLIFFCFDIPKFSAVFLATAGYSCQHITYKVIQLVLLPIVHYAPQVMDSSIYPVLIYAGIFLLSLVIFFLALARKVATKESVLYNSKVSILIGALILVGTTTLNLLFEHYINYMTMIQMYCICSFYDIFGVIMAMLSLFGLFMRSKIEHEYKSRKQLWEQEKKQLKVNKENFSTLMVLAHDLKHAVESIGDDETNVRVSELRERIRSFGNAVETGCESLDLVLAERKQRMDSLGITFSCIADGKALSFMRPTDSYTLFMNLIDNAIEGVSKIEDKKMRIISLNIKKDMDLVFIHEENPYVGEIKFHNGKPRTDKSDKFFHGLGTTSIEYISSQYGGDISFSAADGVFNVNILLDPSKNVEESYF